MIKIENVSYIYNEGRPDAVQALHNISLEIADGSVCAVIGQTGSGKSTLVQLLNGIEKPSSGTIIVNGTDVTSPKTDLRALRFKVGMVFQYPEHQLFEETVQKDIAFGPINMGLSPSETEARVKKAAALVGLDCAKLQSPPLRLSGGERRRAAIAGVLAMEPEVMVFDEPAAGLDPAGRKSIFDLIKALHAKRPKMIIIFVSHSMEDVAETADFAAVMNNGTLAMSGSIDSVFSRAEELIEMGLDVPQITRLCMRLRNAGMPLPNDIYTVKKAVKYLKEILGNV